MHWGVSLKSSYLVCNLENFHYYFLCVVYFLNTVSVFDFQLKTGGSAVLQKKMKILCNRNEEGLQFSLSIRD